MNPFELARSVPMHLDGKFISYEPRRFGLQDYIPKKQKSSQIILCGNFFRKLHLNADLHNHLHKISLLHHHPLIPLLYRKARSLQQTLLASPAV